MTGRTHTRTLEAGSGTGGSIRGCPLRHQPSAVAQLSGVGGPSFGPGETHLPYRK